MPPLLSTDGRRIAEISVLRASQNQRQRNPDFASSGLEAIGAIPSFLDGTHSRLAARPVWPSPNPCTAGLQTNGLPGLWSCEIVSEAIRSRSWTRRGAATGFLRRPHWSVRLSRASRLDAPRGRRPTLIIISTFRGSPCRVGGKLHFPTLEWALWT